MAQQVPLQLRPLPHKRFTSAALMIWRLWTVSAFSKEYGKHVRIKHAACQLLCSCSTAGWALKAF